ncbi:DUF4268 domain-containing protein [Sabulicella glaciei]|uniref:DUF4268 domain-containing protein n=1 Tax=Sabulicella glaciei TaxID=2984948 RepID=A0ABT3P236_9PROT|nr:DUF4268 domain-containing protein [Roseococcus sp. MDT2-1-1]MCW8088474.1 DUF4268 domain-containing protein [Roseococcus sp. MDT2-1-1]
MPILEVSANGLVPIAVTTFEAEGWRERGDLQRLLKDHIVALEEGLMVLTEEFGGWSDSSRRIDLLCLDKLANLVVVELKRTADGGHMELQALRYAAMVSAMTFEQAVETFARHRNRASPDTDGARAEILDFLGWTTAREDSFGNDTRIILAAADFGKELTTTVLWLRERDIDIRCVRLRPHRLANGNLLLEIQQIIPLAETAEFVTSIQNKRIAERKERNERGQLLERFLQQLSERALQRTRIHEGRTPDADLGVLFGAIGKAGVSINYVIARDVSRVEVLFQRDDGRDLLLKLKEDQAEFERAFGGPLDWDEKENVRNCRVCQRVEGGYRSSEEEWPVIQDRLIEAMIRLDGAFRRRIASLQ